MKVFIASDHGGFLLKDYLFDELKKNKYDITDLGTDTQIPVDYVDYAIKTGNAVNKSEGSLGILICRNGLGMSIAANKIKGIRAAKVTNQKDAIKAREHNNANIIALPGTMDFDKALKIVLLFLRTPFSEEIRYIKRIKKIANYEEQR